MHLQCPSYLGGSLSTVEPVYGRLLELFAEFSSRLHCPIYLFRCNLEVNRLSQKWGPLHNSKDRGAVCGSLQRPEILWFTITPTRKSVGYFAAVRLRDGEFLFRRESGRFNGESFWEFLKVFRAASA